MCEVSEQSTRVLSGKPRIAIFLAADPRMALQVRNLERVDPAEMSAILARAAAIRRGEVGPA